jgi:actin-related protein
MFNPCILDVPAAVFGNSSRLCKVGLSGKIGPHHVVSTVVGHPHFNIFSTEANQKRFFVGEDTQHRYDNMFSISH